MPLALTATSVPVVVDDDLCIADKGCKTAYMKYDECWFCMPCEADCPTGAVTVNLPYLLK